MQEINQTTTVAKNNISGSINRKTLQLNEISTKSRSMGADTGIISRYVNKFKSDDFNLALLGLLLFHIGIFVIFQIIDRSNQTWDSAGHIGMSYNIVEQLKLWARGDIGTIDLLRTSDYYPPFVQALGAVLVMIFGYGSNLILSLTLFFYLLAIIFLYVDIKLIGGSSRKAFFASFVFSLFPQVFEQSRVFHLDLPLVALLLIAFYFFVKSKGLQITRYTVWFALFFAFAQLTKWYGFIYLAIPCLAYFVYFQKQGINTKELVKNALISAGIVAVVALPWYIANYNRLVEYSSIFSTGEIDDPQFFWSFYNFFYYPTRILSHQLFLLPSLIVLASLGFLYKRNKNKFWIILASIIVPMFVFTVVGNKNLRYVFPLTPVFAYLITDFLYNLPHTWNSVSRPLKAALVGYLAFAFFFTSFNQIKAQSEILKPIGMLFSANYYNVWVYEPQLYSYNRDYWPIDEIWDFIALDSGNFQEVFGVTPLFDKRNLSLATFELMRRENGYTKAYVPVPYFQFEPFGSETEILDYLNENNVKYVLVTEDPGPIGLRNYAVLDQMTKYFLSRRNAYYEQVKTFELPDGYTLKVFKRLPPGQKLDYTVSAQCKSDAGLDDGIETIQLRRNHTYVFYTGHYGLDRTVKAFEEGTIYIVQIENIPHESNLDVYNLPHVGTGMCIFDTIDIDLTDAIRRPLIEPNHCAVDCEKVVHIKWVVGDAEPVETIYYRGDFTTEEDVGVVEDAGMLDSGIVN